MVLREQDGSTTTVPVAHTSGVTGRYRSSEGLEGDSVWGTRARWVALDGIVEEEPVTIAILNHPENPGFPTYWHARGYGGLGQMPTQTVLHSRRFRSANYYPTHLWIGGDPLRWDTLANEYFNPHQVLEGDPEDPASYSGYSGEEYAPDLMTEHALRFIRDHKDEPFFLYLAYTIPHLALQVPEAELEAYSFPETPYLGTANPEASSPSYLPHPQPRAAYAGMISRLDDYVGQVIATLRELGLYENTLIVFTSNNGPTYTGGVDYEFFDSNGPLRGLKGSVYEGGIRVPMIASWPGRIPPGTTTDHPAANWDVMPTLAELTGASLPGETDGVSFLPTLLGDPDGADRARAALLGALRALWSAAGAAHGKVEGRTGRHSRRLHFGAGALRRGGRSGGVAKCCRRASRDRSGHLAAHAGRARAIRDRAEPMKP